MAAKASRNSLTETGISSDLNRIITRRVASSSKKDKEGRSSRAEYSEKLNGDGESFSSVWPHVKQKLGAMVKGRVRINQSSRRFMVISLASRLRNRLSRLGDQISVNRVNSHSSATTQGMGQTYFGMNFNNILLSD